MRIISSGGQAALDRGRCDSRALLKLMPSGSDPLCLWDDRGPISYNGDVYLGRPGRFTCSPITSSGDYSVRNMDVTLSGIDATAIGMVESSLWHQRPILLYRAIISVDAPQILNISPEFAGFMDTLEWGEVVNGVTSLVLHCESSSREYSRTGARTASDADQRERDPNDGILRYAQSAVSTTVEWGTSPQAPPKQKQSSGLLGFLDKIF